MSLSTVFWDLGRWAGLIGFTCLSLLIISGDTARFFDRYVGLDRIIKFQRKFSLFTAVFVVLHPTFFMLSSGSVAYYILPDFTVLPFAMGAMAFYLFAAIMVASHFYKRISYAGWQVLHVLTYALFFMGLYHASNWGSDAGHPLVRILYGTLTLGVLIGIVYRTRYKLLKLRTGRFFVKELRQETKDTFTLVLRPEKPFAFKAGQFCFLRLNKDRLHARHPFTISSSPAEPDLRFTIKKAGRFTASAARLAPGEEVKVDGPFGRFQVKDGEKPLVFIAGGVGITPFMSLIKDHAEQGIARDVLLLYGSRTEADIIFKDALDAIDASWLTKVHVLSEASGAAAGHESGRIDEALLRKYVKDIRGSLYFICGPEVMKDSVVRSLISLGVRKNDILTEDFFW